MGQQMALQPMNWFTPSIIYSRFDSLIQRFACKFSIGYSQQLRWMNAELLWLTWTSVIRIGFDSLFSFLSIDSHLFCRDYVSHARINTAKSDAIGKTSLEQVTIHSRGEITQNLSIILFAIHIQFHGACVRYRSSRVFVVIPSVFNLLKKNCVYEATIGFVSNR